MQSSRAVLSSSLILVVLVEGILLGCGGGGSGGGEPGPTYAISGTIRTPGGTAMVGVGVSLDSSSQRTPAIATTDTDGRYSFSGLSSGTYVITPSSAGANFSPRSHNTVVNDADVADNDFVGANQVSVLGSGIDFLPQLFSSSEQLRASLVVESRDVFFTDSSDLPLKRISLDSGAVTALARRMNTPESVFVHGQSVFWVEGETLNRTALDGAATTILASGERDPLVNPTAEIVVDDTDAYWVNTVSSLGCSPSCTWVIRRVPLDGGTPVTLVTVDDRSVVALADDADNLYWEEEGAIKGIPKIGGAPFVIVDNSLNGTAGGWSPTGGIALSGSDLIFGVAGDGSYDLKSIPVAGGAVSTLASVATTPSFAGHITDIGVSGDNVYWYDPVNGEVATVPVAGGAVTTVAGDLEIPSYSVATNNLVVDSTNAYWTEVGPYVGCCAQRGAGSVKTVSLSGGPVSTLISGLDAPHAMAVDSSNLVWAEDWRVGKAPFGGGPPTTLASGIESEMARIAVDEANVYILDGSLIKMIPIAGGTPQKLTAVAGGSISDLSTVNHDIATDGVSVFWTVGGGGYGPSVQKVPVAGGSVVVLADASLGGTMDCYWRILVDAENVYWSSSSPTFGTRCSIKKVPIDGGVTTTLVDFELLRDFTVDDTDVYFSELSASGSIRKAPIDGGPIATVAENAHAWVLTNDADNLYWVDISDLGGIGHFAKKDAGDQASGFLSGPLATDPFLAAEGIVVGRDGLFWTETVSGDIYAIE